MKLSKNALVVTLEKNGFPFHHGLDWKEYTSQAIWCTPKPLQWNEQLAQSKTREI